MEEVIEQKPEAQEGTERPASAGSENTESTDVTEAPDTSKAPEEKDETPAPIEAADGRKSGVAKRIDELVKLREEARRDAEYWRKIAIEKLGAAKKDASASPAPSGGKGEKPDPSKFKTYDQYVEALTDWKVREKMSLEAEARRRDEAGRRLAERITAAEKKYPDFRNVALNPDVSITPLMFEAIVESEAGAEVAYFLGKHPDEAERLSRLSPLSAVKEIGRIEAKLIGAERIEPRRVTQAPSPVRTLEGSGEAADRSPAEMSMDEYRAWRTRRA